MSRGLVKMIRVNIPSNLKVSEEQFEALAIANRDLRLERKHDGELIIMPPTGSNTGKKNLKIAVQLGIWTERPQTGTAFDSSSGFKLPNGAVRAPDASWVSDAKWNALTTEQQDSFAPICPEFVVELRSPADSLTKIREKMSEYMDNGALLGWLIDPINKKIEIYRQGKTVEILDNPATVSGENILPGFTLNLDKIW